MADPNTVMGIGIGTFLIIFVWSISLLLCIAFTRVTGALSNIGIASMLFAIVFTIILLVLPREEFEASTEKIYDYSVIYRSVLIAVVCVFLIIGVIALVLTHLMEPVFAKPLRKMRN